jgi:metallo-beta-lactamase family protein
MKITFLGAAGTVTGSKYLLETEKTRLLVDCGLYQGVKSLRIRNRKPLAAEPSSLDAVLLTHAHIDHSGLLPLLVREGFQGPIHATPPTTQLCEILLPDAAHIQEEDALYANRKGFSKHHPALPLYTREDAEKSLEQFRSLPFEEEGHVGDLAFRLLPAGHILGAASIEVSHRGRTIHFSGDLGRPDDLLMRPPMPPRSPDYVVIESTYGDRIHPAQDPIATLASILRETVSRGGILLIPSFAVGRAQTLLFCFHEIFRRKLARRVPVYLNSPMATSVTELFRESCDYHRLQPDQCGEIFAMARFVRSVEESRALAGNFESMVLISASGMASGGRVLHHLKALAPDRRNTILLPGFQAPGTRGDAIARGVETVKIHGTRVPVNAEVRQLDMLSAHADQKALLDWIGDCEKPPKHVFVTHGESVPADTLRQLTTERFGIPAHVPELGESFELD